MLEDIESVLIEFLDEPSRMILNYTLSHGGSSVCIPSRFALTIGRYYPHERPLVYCLDEGYTCQLIAEDGEVLHRRLWEDWSAIDSLKTVIDSVQEVREAICAAMISQGRDLSRMIGCARVPRQWEPSHAQSDPPDQLSESMQESERVITATQSDLQRFESRPDEHVEDVGMEDDGRAHACPALHAHMREDMEDCKEGTIIDDGEYCMEMTHTLPVPRISIHGNWETASTIGNSVSHPQQFPSFPGRPAQVEDDTSRSASPAMFGLGNCAPMNDSWTSRSNGGVYGPSNFSGFSFGFAGGAGVGAGGCAFDKQSNRNNGSHYSAECGEGRETTLVGGLGQRMGNGIVGGGAVRNSDMGGFSSLGGWQLAPSLLYRQQKGAGPERG